jgi:hypothetical protein
MMMWGTGSPPNLEIPLIPEIAGMAGTGWVDQNSTSKRHGAAQFGSVPGMRRARAAFAAE